MRLQAAVVVFIATILTVMSEDFTFSCKRIPEMCFGDSTCDGTGNCTCPPNYTGYNCLVTNFSLGDLTCDPPCGNGGTCYKEAEDSTSGLCSCPYGYYGDSCESKFINIQCGVNETTFSLSFPPEFAGRFVFVDENGTALDAANCPVTENNTDRRMLDATVDISDTATNESMTCYKKVVEGDVSTFTGYFLVHYDSELITSQDELLQLNCIHMTSNLTVSSEIMGVPLQDDILDKIDQSENYRPISLDVLDNANQTLGNEVSLGEMIQLVLYLDANSGYETLIFLDCVANNTLDLDDSKTFQLLQNSCPTKRGKIVSVTQETTSKSVDVEGTQTDVNGVVVKFEAFKFPNADQIGVLCTAKICKADDNSCALPEDCDVTSGNRRKRAADDEEQVSMVFTIRGNNDRTNDQNINQEQEQEQEAFDTLERCMASPELTAVVAVLASLVCVLLIACFILACLLLRRGGKRVTSYDANTLQPTADRFQIPRAHVNESYGEL